jgi:TatD DNase family protein
MLIDTHVHLDDKRYDDLQDVLQRAKDVGVEKFIIPGADPLTLKRAVALSQEHENVFFAVGIHPYDANNYDEALLESYILHSKCVAVGECGLDYFRLEGSEEEKQQEKQLQKDVFVSQINLAKKYKKPLIVHIRDASKDSKELLLKNGANEVGGVLHCFNADEELLSLANDGFYFGIGGVVTFKNAKKLVKVLPKIPIERVLIETDAPYLTPEPHRGKRNEPSYTTYIAKKISEILGVNLQIVEQITTKNATKLFF